MYIHTSDWFSFISMNKYIRFTMCVILLPMVLCNIGNINKYIFLP